ncbi:hypothetical protein CLV30_101206 [Haloactinopolyspora alba]|uniref:Uncharacterized protein n=1 Tax=Haloactinopolyspora alba TaxID=648780 RepID=A0A2P8EFJ0_9ACTN|nr:hypothetical protein [Haloactinopolyspora alba]PSL08236.1 hypothetical protein CLV30_101206 [Haloactinopolyspora alba]
MSSQQHTDARTADASAAPANRAERRARRAGKSAPSGTTASPRKNDQVRQSQVLAQPRFKGRRGNR